MESEWVMFAAYFFLDNQHWEHKRNVFGVLDGMSNIGGMITCMLVFYNGVGQYVNK